MPWILVTYSSLFCINNSLLRKLKKKKKLIKKLIKKNPQNTQKFINLHKIIHI